ncbi:MBL fold metallo-hydrolase [Arenicella xantha]|uniref:Glyoxylase-like metal-dependent hydrolase (Beta-lactamase superfamily II) n=1 Tax=Arenicella xantha TaxID=644221 RepID=A0A395JKA3_9GAMM|nr:MBL fold metallo-hydrolase [Arenicella xantha]RBP49218.1 glyoxylase-like metal-dependent hydrolase (beta-lactamase superfamily II) [Arenicella xantha]
MTLKFEIIPVTPFAQNCSVVWCSDTRLAAVIDPGGEIERIRGVLGKLELELDKILITHAHLDHAGGTAELARATGVPIIGPHKADQFWIDLLPEQCQRFGFDGETFTPDQWLEHGDQVALGNLTFNVAHCPGHTPGHVVFVEQSQHFAAVGDVLFQGSIGRSDFPQGNQQQLIDSIRNRLFPLGDDIQFIPGHGPMSNFGHERRTNPFVADQRFG